MATRNDLDQVFDASGKVVASNAVVRDVTVETNYNLILARASAALASNQTYLAIGTPTNAQVVAQVSRLTRECSALIRMLLQSFQDASDT